MDNIKEIEYKGLEQIAALMCVAARTAPKSKGIDTLVSVLLTSEEKSRLIEEMKRIGDKEDIDIFLRDAKCVEQSNQVLVMGLRTQRIGIKNCGMCGYKNCSDNQKNNGLCVFNVIDLGIAIGSSVNTASFLHADNRIMYTVGKAALNLKLLGEEVRLAFGIPLSCSSKNPFFDRVFERNKS